MTKEIMNINGRSYNIEYQGTLTSEQRNYVINKLTYSGSIANLATCPTSAKNVGDVAALTASGTEGTPPYTLTFKRNSVVLPNGTFTGVGAGVSKNYNYTIVSADAPSVTLSTEIADSCSTGAKTCGDQCVINVSVAPPTCPSVSCAFSVNGGAPITKYSCSAGNCIVDPNGIYTEPTCGGQCAAPPTRYRCDTATNTCVADPNGTYPDLATCQAQCIPSEIRYACKTLYGVKYCDIDPNGPYTDYMQCKAACI